MAEVPVQSPPLHSHTQLRHRWLSPSRAAVLPRLQLDCTYRQRRAYCRTLRERCAPVNRFRCSSEHGLDSGVWLVPTPIPPRPAVVLRGARARGKQRSLHCSTSGTFACATRSRSRSMMRPSTVHADRERSCNVRATRPPCGSDQRSERAFHSPQTPALTERGGPRNACASGRTMSEWQALM